MSARPPLFRGVNQEKLKATECSKDYGCTSYEDNNVYNEADLHRHIFLICVVKVPHFHMAHFRMDVRLVCFDYRK